jgi:DnaJ-class molecular chaperone
MPGGYWNRRPQFFYSYGLLQEFIRLERLRQARQSYNQPQQPIPAPAQPPSDPYAVLGVSRIASKEEISAAYRKKAKENHPDTVAHLGAELRDLAEEKMKEINAAYDLLKN